MTEAPRVRALPATSGDPGESPKDFHTGSIRPGHNHDHRLHSRRRAGRPRDPHSTTHHHPPASIKVAIDGQSSRVAWPSLPDSVGYRIAWVNLRDMLAAMDDGAHWTERMSHTNLPASRTSHRVMHLQPDTRHAFAVGVDAPDGTIRWSRWSYVTTGPAEACSCQQGPQTPPPLTGFNLHPSTSKPPGPPRGARFPSVRPPGPARLRPRRTRHMA